MSLNYQRKRTSTHHETTPYGDRYHTESKKEVKMAKINKQTGEEIMSMREKGYSTRDIEKYLADIGVCASAATIRRRCKTRLIGHTNRKPRKMTMKLLEAVDAILNENDELSAKNVRDLLKTRHNMSVGMWTVKKAFGSLGWTRDTPRQATGSKEGHLSRSLALKTAQLESERKEAAAKFAAMEKQHQEEIASLRADLQNRVAELVAANQRLTEELAAARSPSASPSSRATLLSGLKRQHPDIIIPELTSEQERKISQLSGGRIDRYGCFLFQAAVGIDTYHSWCCNTNWTGSGGKWELPRNLQEYLLNALTEKFNCFGEREYKMLTGRINELLRKPRQLLAIA